MIVNLWMGFDDRAQSTAKTEDEFGQFGAGFRDLGDPNTPGLFRVDSPLGPRTYELWSLYYEAETDDDCIQIRNDLNAIYPGRIRTIGGWWFDGRQVGTEFTYTVIPNPDYNGDVENPTIPNPLYQPDPELPDFNDLETLRNPVYDGALTITEIGTDGDPVFPLHTRIIQFIPDVVTHDGDGNETGRTRPSEPTDVNLGMGQTPRRFT